MRFPQCSLGSSQYLIFIFICFVICSHSPLNSVFCVCIICYMCCFVTCLYRSNRFSTISPPLKPLSFVLCVHCYWDAHLVITHLFSCPALNLLRQVFQVPSSHLEALPNNQNSFQSIFDYLRSSNVLSLVFNYQLWNLRAKLITLVSMSLVARKNNKKIEILCLAYRISIFFIEKPILYPRPIQYFHSSSAFQTYSGVYQWELI